MSIGRKSRFAVFFGNRAFFPASLQGSARRQVRNALKKLGHDALMMNPRATQHGAVETIEEGQKYANFLRENRGKFDGVILCLPNFGDENGALMALKDAGVPIYIQAYPDELDKMAPELRRDAFCGKFSIMDVFHQNDVPFTVLQPHTVHPSSDDFAENIDYFDRVCRVVGGLREMRVGAIGARTTPFKTVRVDEIALQRHGITVETFDLSDLFARMKAFKSTDPTLKAAAQRMKAFTSWTGVPAKAFDNIARLGAAIDELIDECQLDAVAVRCWPEFQEQVGISPCVVLGELNERGIAAACEVDVAGAVAMRALSLASGNPPALLDWNNNYGDDEDKCILFHCGPVPSSLMSPGGRVTDHAIIGTSVGKECTYGCNVGRIAPTPFTYGGMITEDGDLCFYLGEGRFTDDPISPEFFGCAGVAEIFGLQDVLQTLGRLGHRHHVSVAPGNVLDPIAEAFENYLGYDVTVV